MSPAESLPALHSTLNRSFIQDQRLDAIEPGHLAKALGVNVQKVLESMEG